MVEGRHVDADGTPVGDNFLINTTTANLQFDPSMALLGNGHNVASFTDHSSGTDVVRIRILGDGAPEDDFAVPANAKPLRESDITALGSDGFAVAYTRDYGGGDTDVFVQRYEADGDLVGGVIVVDSSAVLATDHASIVGLVSGGFVVTWEQSATAGGDHSVWFRLYDASGVAQGGSQSIDTSGSINQDIQVAALQDGGFVVAYADNGWVDANGGDDENSTEITARVYNADGTARSGYFVVNTDILYDQLHPTITVLSNGFFVVGWISGSQLFYQAYDPSGTAIGDNYITNNIGVTEAEIAALADGRMANVHESFITDGAGTSIRSSIHALTRTTAGTAADEILTGDALRDIISGASGDDTLDGGTADDTLFGDADNDVLRGGMGADDLDGGLGTDTASYYNA
ncbi:MAG TPA: hypothetical protein VIQ53_03010, partial [Inquilinus sp.]